MLKPTAIAAAFAVAVPTANAGLNKCVHPDGKVSYQQTACPGGADATEIEAAPAPPGSQLVNPDYWTPSNQAARLAKMRPQAPDKPTKPSNRVPRPQHTDIMNAIVGHEIIRGMNAEEVREALGPPNSTYTGSGDHLSWDYSGTDSKGRYRSMTLQFRDGLLDTWSQYGTTGAEPLETDSGRWMK